ARSRDTNVDHMVVEPRPDGRWARQRNGTERAASLHDTQAEAEAASLAPGVTGGDDMRAEILGLCRQQLGPSLTPRALTFHSHIERTESGKITRRHPWPLRQT
ncbi:MAG: DUF2188 domain-containing protein, partial [Ilumatobacteraceae bacterium]